MTYWNLSVEVVLQQPTMGHTTMKKDRVIAQRQPEGDLLSTMLREVAQRMIAEVLQAQFDEFLSQFAEQLGEQGRATGVRNA